MSLAISIGLLSLFSVESAKQQSSAAHGSSLLKKNQPVEYVMTSPTLSPIIQPTTLQYRLKDIRDNRRNLQATGGGSDCPTTFSQPRCKASLTVADTNRNDEIDKDEYVSFVDRLNPQNTFVDDDTEFDDLPGNVRNVFQKYSDSRRGNYMNISGSKPGQLADTDQGIFLDDMCCEATIAVDEPGAPFATSSPQPVEPSAPTQAPIGDKCAETISRTQCSAYMSYADLSRDNLMDEDEYLRFIARFSMNGYTDVPYEELPCNFIQNYEKFATGAGGQIDITGGKPGQPAPSDDQDEHLTDLCCETDLAVQNPETTCAPTVGPPPTVAPEPSAPTIAPEPSGPPVSAPPDCKSAMASSDFNRDDYLNQEEYVRFLNRRTQNLFLGQTFDELPQSLKCNYENLKDPTKDEISVIGSKPGQTATDDEERHLVNICSSTDEALTSESTACSNTSSPAPVAPVTPTLPPTFADNICRVSISSSDFDRDDYLNEDEYVTVLNRLTRNQFLGETFDTLEYPFPETYVGLTDETGQIYIFGAKAGQDADDDQEEFIIEICFQISHALIGETIAPTPSIGEPTFAPGPTTVPDPTPVPEPPTYVPEPPPTFPPGISEVYNSFLVTNSEGLTAAEVANGTDFDNLNTAYGEFAEQATNDLNGQRESGSVSRLLRKRRRRLEVSFVNASEDIYLLVDLDCPESIPGEVGSCLTAYASFQVTIDDEDPDEVSAFYTAGAQALISDGLLQQVLTETDPQSSLVVRNASFPVKNTTPPTTGPGTTPSPSTAPSPNATTSSMPSTQPTISPQPSISFQPSISPSPTVAPNVTETDSPVAAPTGGGEGSGDDDKDEKGGGGSAAGAVIGVVAVIILLGGGGYFYHKRYGFPSCPTVARVGQAKKPGSGSDFKGSDRDGESDNGREPYGMGNIFGSSPGASDKKDSGNTFGNDVDDDSDGEDNGFGFGNNEPAEDNKDEGDIAFGGGNTFGSMAQETNNTFNTFGNDTKTAFGFDDAAFGSPKASPADKKDSNVFDNPAVSPGWFGDAAFGEEEKGGSNDDDQSGSGTNSDEESYRSGEESYHSGSQGSRSYDDEGNSQGSRSYYSDEEGHSQGSGSYRSGEGSGSYRSGEGSYHSGSQGSRSYYSGDEEGRSYHSGEGSQTYRSGEGSQSYQSGDGEEGSYYSQEGSRSYYSGEEDGDRSYHSGEESYRSGEGSQSYISGEGSQSYRSGDEEGSYNSQEGSRSYYSGEEEGSYRSGNSQGSRSYYSDEEGSYDEEQ